MELKELTAASLEKLMDGHKALQDQQGKLYEGQEQMENSLRDNLERLGQEKALIASGQELVAKLIKGITKKMGKRYHVFMYFGNYLAFSIFTCKNHGCYFVVILSVCVCVYVCNLGKIWS